MKIKREVWFLLVLFLASFLLKSFLALSSPMKYWDETIYVNLARNLATYHEYSFLHGFADFSVNWPLAGFRPPLLPFILALSPFNNLFANLIVPFIGSLGVVLVFILAKKLFDAKIAVYSSVIFLLIPMNLLWGSKILTDAVFVTSSVP